MDRGVSGIILAGGLSTRFNGENKSQLIIGGRRIIDRLLTVFADLFDDIILVTNEPLQYLDLDLKIVTDIVPLRSSLTGIYSGLFYAGHRHAFVTACDTPFLAREMVELVIESIDAETDIVMPSTSAGLEPLCAAYSKNCLKPAEQHLKQRKLKIQLALRRCRIKTIAEDRLRAVDPELLSFFNVNEPGDLVRAEQLASGRITINAGKKTAAGVNDKQADL